jgi:hypothetical protein
VESSTDTTSLVRKGNGSMCRVQKGMIAVGIALTILAAGVAARQAEAAPLVRYEVSLLTSSGEQLQEKLYLTVLDGGTHPVDVFLASSGLTQYGPAGGWFDAGSIQIGSNERFLELLGGLAGLDRNTASVDLYRSPITGGVGIHVWPDPGLANLNFFVTKGGARSSPLPR